MATGDDAIKENRVKIISLDAKLMADILNWWRHPPYWISLPITEQIPEDVVVVSVHASYERRCIEAIIASDSFPPCPCGAMPERIPGMVTEFRGVPFNKLEEYYTHNSTEKGE
jgi:hypothetical protein